MLCLVLIPMVLVKVASLEDLHLLSGKLLALIRDKSGEAYQENVAKFGIPNAYVEKAFSVENLLRTANEVKATFYLAMENEEIVGFAQMNPEDQKTAELDRIIVFPDHARRGIGTLLLNEVVRDQKRRGINTIVVNAGREETHARSFYEKNQFRQVKEVTVDAPWGDKLPLVTYERQI
jgi:ribosomal protein S18 acetylase RimI-like enzyme